ncbi:hypothetical protein TL18_08615 [Methanobrevibacter sp. YE315]|uniref:hypothetical protein n=1 Tax=Methanobrevibacter sp. YE315 TaxID=1609968 RepID=UPI000764D47A|nr:hypothetical protein [Methanobrevibacter sp. YE315]AMD18073.1 hypothetical protein TL18_08615 [Methanobrevibacter sp. YE315]
MKNLVKNVIEVDFDEIETYDFPLDEPFGLDINYKGIRYCLVMRLSSTNKNLICCGPGAHGRNVQTSDGTYKKPPFIQRWSWYKYFEESFIAYADPIFFYDERITLGWLVGDKNQWYLETVSEIIKKICKNQGIYHSNILFYSSSGGGFTSTGLGTLIKGSKVLVNNPQMNILNYHEFHINHLFRILYKEFPGLTKSQIIKKIGYRIDMIKLFKKEKYIPPITYYLNVESDDDLYNHCIPFINDIKKLPYFKDNLIIHAYREVKSSPHGPISTAESVRIIKEYAKQYLNNNEESEDNQLKNNLLK